MHMGPMLDHGEVIAGQSCKMAMHFEHVPKSCDMFW
jgi:hypothetical protein